MAPQASAFKTARARHIVERPVQEEARTMSTGGNNKILDKVARAFSGARLSRCHQSIHAAIQTAGTSQATRHGKP
jgi:hypothetical protein